MSLLIHNGEIITGATRYVADIFCEGETITRIDRRIDGEEMKSQIPNPKFQRNPKLQAPRGAVLGGDLELGAWSFFGIWSLGFGASAS